MAWVLAAAFALAPLGMEASASPSQKFNEPKCGAAYYKAFAKAQARIRKSSLDHVTSTCDGASASEIGLELDEDVDAILEKLNKQLGKLQEEGFCDAQLPFPVERADLLKNEPDVLASGSATGEAFLNGEVTGTCDEPPSP